MKSAGVKKFQWLHSAGGRDPRPLHINDYPSGLNGGIFSFDDLPVIDEKTGERGIAWASRKLSVQVGSCN